MKKRRVLSVSLATLLGVVLVVLLALAFSFGPVASQKSDEAHKEIDKALEAEKTATSIKTPVVLAESIGELYPLFMGVDDAAVPTYLMDPTTNMSMTAFVGAEVWGSAYDAENDRILFNAGTTLYSWPLGSGTITPLGSIVDTTGSFVAMVGLAHYDGQLYGTRNIPNEAVYAIETISPTLTATIYIDYNDGEFDFDFS